MAGVAVLVAAALATRLAGPGAGPASPAPWQLERVEGRLQAFGLQLPGTTLAQLELRFGSNLVLALVERRGRADSLEAYVERHDAGGVLGRLVFELQADAAQLQRWREASPRQQRGGADTLRHELAASDRSAAQTLAVQRIVFIVQSRLAPEAIEQRFGPPSERQPLPGGVECWHWQRTGVELLRSADGAVVLSYPAPGVSSTCGSATLHEPLLGEGRAQGPALGALRTAPAS